jgi:hypothetical protein
VRRGWTQAHEAALERAREAQAKAQPEPMLSPAVRAQRARREKEDAANPPSAEVIARREVKQAKRPPAKGVPPTAVGAEFAKARAKKWTLDEAALAAGTSGAVFVDVKGLTIGSPEDP